MNLIEHTFELRGKEGLGAKPRPELIGPVLTNLHGTLLDTVRMGFLRSSRTPGRIPHGLKLATDVRYLGHTEGPKQATVLRFEVPRFVDAAPELFEQAHFWDIGPKPDETAFDLLSRALVDVRCMAKDSARFDHALLNRFARFRRVLGHGLDVIALNDANTPSQIDAELSDAAESLYRQTPPPRRVRISGRLDMLGVSRRVLGLLLEGRTAVNAVWTGERFTDLAKYLDHQVVIEGIAQFRPSGSLLRIDAESIDEASADDLFFSTLPLPEIQTDYQAMVSSSRPSQSPYSSIFGTIRGDESDDEFAAAVEELS